MKKTSICTILLGLSVGFFFLLKPKPIPGAELTSVKDTLSSSRLSFIGSVASSGNTAGGTTLTIKTSSLPGWATSDANFNLFSADTLHVGSTTDYTVIDIIDDASDNKILLYPGLSSSDIDENDPVIATRSAQHTVTFTPISVINNGYYRIRLKATAGGAGDAVDDWIDGIPDADGFDFRSSFNTSWISCPDSGVASIEYSGDTHCPSGYSCVFCSYTGNNTLAQKTLTVGTTAAAQQPINPAPSSTSKTMGQADTYVFYVDHLDSSYAGVDSTSGKLAVVESIRVTATVDPTIELTIAGIATGETACGSALDVTTTATSVPFGSVSITNFTNAAQNITVSTNADEGYAVTTLASDQLNLITGTGVDTGTNIPDTPGDDTAASHTTKDEWESTSTKGFGYSLENVDANTISFEYSDTDGGCTGGAGTFCAKQFADNSTVEAAQTIFNSGTTADSENAYVCYRIIVASTQEAGTYTNAITYIASATF